MIFQGDMGFLKVLADIVSLLLGFLRPIVQPIGEWMISWIQVVLEGFPEGMETLPIYFMIFILLIVAGAIVNSVWPGDKPLAKTTIKSERKEDSVAKK